MNTRLEDIAAPLLKNNASLCPKTSRDIGITVHTAGDYPEQLRPVAESLLGVSDALSIRTVRAGSSADEAGLQAGDEITAVNNRTLRGSGNAQLRYSAISRAEFRADVAQIHIMRGDQPLTLNVQPETICGYPVIVFFNERANGHTDGREVWITSELMRTVSDDVNLALIVAHEMSHAIAGHLNIEQSKELELEADRMALVLMERAGFDIDRAVSYWKNAKHPHRDQQEISDTHPTIEERFDNFRMAQKRIQGQQSRGEIIRFGP